MAAGKSLVDIRRQLSAGEFEFSHHAFKQAVDRNISDIEIRQAAAQIQLIEVSMCPAACCGLHRNGPPLAYSDSVQRFRLVEDHYALMSRTWRSGMMISQSGGSSVSLSRVWKDRISSRIGE
ncbi:MAG: hypothetical protein NNA18_07940 [Nitrospira sp.]|nr:hypothetical protein [Nitrospira sp.]